MDRSVRTNTKTKSSKTSTVQPESSVYEWQVSFRIGSADSVNVCEDGWLYGPFTMRGTDKPETSDTTTVAAEPSTVDVINFGTFDMCIEISSPIDLTLDVTNFSVDVTTCDEEPANFAGEWSGTYSCDNEGCADIPTEEITLTVTQEPGSHSASYTDGEAFYEGTVCGNVFTYNGGVEGEFGYIEKGTMTLNADGSAHKVSTFKDNSGPCQGECEDFLTRAET